MLPTLRIRATMIVQIGLVVLIVNPPRACSQEPDPKASDKLPLSRDFATGSTVPGVRRLPTSVQWDGREYDVDSGIDVLMSVVRDPAESADERHRALLGLVMLYRRLEGRPCLDELARLYDNASESHKAAILTCFQASDDPRGIPVFLRTLDKEQNMKLRLWAAGALAHWNIRRGVAEIVHLLESKETIPKPSRMPFVRDNALESFRKRNARKGWGFREEEVRMSIGRRTDLDQDQQRDLYIAEIKKWFTENEHRFPDWKLGDPLPQSSTLESHPLDD